MEKNISFEFFQLLHSIKQMTEELQKLVDMVREAGRILLHFRKEGFQVEWKADDSPVTQADKKANAFIVEALSRLTPGIPVIAEESAAPDYETRKGWQQFWLVDPLDGTKEFMRGSEEFTVNVARIEKGVPVVGVIYAPVPDTLYYASQSAGSWKVVEGGAPVRLMRNETRSPYRVVLSRSHPSPLDDEFLNTLRVRGVVRAGSSLKFAALAEDRADLYPRFSPCMEWDVAAGDAIYRYSSSDRGKSPLIYNKPSLRNGPFVVGAASKYDLKKGGLIALTGAVTEGFLESLRGNLLGYGYDCRIAEPTSDLSPSSLTTTWWLTGDKSLAPSIADSAIHYAVREEFPTEGNVLAILEKLAQKN
ncbi:MAG: 3'(2'),5'-bisphosphate nucleotidase CysQ [Bdellovibrionota bacterium]